MRARLTVCAVAVLTGLVLRADGDLLFKIGIMTDTHVGSWFTKDASHVKKAAELFKREGVDAIVNVGDICDRHEPRFYRMYREAVDAVFPPGKSRPTEYFVYAWHDSFAYKGHPRVDSVKDAPEAFADVRTLLRAANAPDDQVEISGFPVLFFQQFQGDEFRERTLSEVEQKYPEKPIFVFDHVPAAGTVDRSGEWGSDGTRAVYNRHPRVIQISGHVHGSLRNERNIWQGEFTSVNAGCLQVWGKGSVLNHDVMTMEVSAHAVTFRRFDMRDGKEFGADARWTVPLPFDPATAPYRPEARLSKPVEFAPSGALAVSTRTDKKAGPMTVVTLPPLKKGQSAFKYRVRVTGRAADGRALDLYERFEFGDFYLRPEERTGKPLACTFPVAVLTPGERATIEVSPFGFFGPEGRPLRTEVVGAARGDEVVFESRKPMEDLLFFWCDKAGDRAERAIAADGFYRRDGRLIGLLELPAAATTDAVDGGKVRVTVEFSTRSPDDVSCSAGIAGMEKPDWNVLASAVRCRPGDASLKRVVREYLPRQGVPRAGVYLYAPATSRPCAVRFERILVERLPGDGVTAGACVRASTDGCPHWISVMPLAADDAAGIAADAVTQGNETIIDGVAWIVRLCPEGNPAADLAARYADDYRRIEPLVRARSKVKQGVLLQSTMGHGGFPGEATPWQLSVKADGTSVYRMCPLDPRFLDYIAKSCRTLAALKPDFFMVDDDTRLHWNGVLGCFCPLHLAALEKATGRAWTREEAARLAKAGDADFLKVWEKVYFDSMAAFFRTIRANFDPATPGMLCTVSAAAHFRHAKAFAEMLAAPGQVPVVRGNGANYGGNEIYHCVNTRASFARQLGEIGSGVVFLQEADTCPQQLWSCSATREYENMLLQALEGVKGAKIWITRNAMPRERRSQAAYRRILAANRGILEWAAKADFRQAGVVVPNVGITDYIREWLGWAERYLALTGIPYRYGEASTGEVTALCAATLTRLGRAEIERILSGAVLLDGTGANWLATNGFADLIGADAKPWARKTIQRHLDENGVSLGGMRVDGEFADLTALRPGAEVLSRLYNVPSRGAEPAYEAPGAIAFTNARGGRVIVCALPLREQMPAYYNHTLFSESYQAWIVRLIERLGGKLQVRFAGAGPVLCEAGRTSADGDVFVLDPLDIDDLVEPEMAFVRAPASVERLMGDGGWKPVRFEAEPTGFVRLKDSVRAKNPTVYRWK